MSKKFYQDRSTPSPSINPQKSSRPATIAEISLDNLSYNYRQIKQRVAPCEVMAVVKANAYGHGAVPVAQHLLKAGVQFFAVARLQEALELRNAGIDSKLLIFGRLFPAEMAVAIRNNICITLTCEEDIELIAEQARKLDRRACVHLNVDTGMGRTGLLPPRAIPALRTAYNNQYIKVTGLYSHFATADLKDKDYARQQLQRFKEIIRETRQHDLQIPYIHMANGGAMLDLPESYGADFNLVRAGIILYGYYPSLETSESISLKQVMRLKTRILELRQLPAGSHVSYGCRYTTQQTTRLAVLPIGYADGIHRAFTNKGIVLIRGQQYPVVGTVTMDQIMVEVGDAPVEIGDEVLFWGTDEQGELRASRIAARINTISYELCCAVSQRVPRIYPRP